MAELDTVFQKHGDVFQIQCTVFEILPRVFIRLDTAG